MVYRAEYVSIGELKPGDLILEPRGGYQARVKSIDNDGESVIVSYSGGPPGSLGNKFKSNATVAKLVKVPQKARR